MATANRGPEPLWTSVEAAAAVNGTCLGDWNAVGISIDSRAVLPGELFVALRGPSNDGHDYVAAALARGASAAMVDHVPAGVPDNAPLLLVGDTQIGHEALGAAARKRTAAKIIAVTGSAGKTGTKEMLRTALGRQARTHASEASYNNLWGVPLSLSRMARASEYGVFEIGMNHSGEITPLTRLVRPHAAIVTTVAPAHIGHFASITEIAEAKAEIFLGLEPGGIAIINHDNAFFDLLSRRARDAGAAQILGFGTAPDAAARLIKAVHHTDCSCVYAEICGQPLTYKIGLSGAHWVMNSLAVLTAVHVLGGDLALAAIALAGMAALPGRGRQHKIALAEGEFTLIDESYNANPASMEAALLNLSGQLTQGRGRKIAVLGDMAELGENSARYHRDLAKIITDGRIHLTFTTGSQMKFLHESLPHNLRAGHAGDADALMAPLKAALRPGDVVVVKGSHSSGMGTIVKALLGLVHPNRQGQGGRMSEPMDMEHHDVV